MLRAYAGTLVVVVVPGLLVASIIGLRLRELLTWAAIPAFSLATVFVLGEITVLLRLPFGVPTFAVFLLVLGGVLLFVRSKRARPSRTSDETRRPEHSDRPPSQLEPRFSGPIAYVLLGLGIAVGAFTWYRGLRGVPLIPPGADGTRHGWMVARILYDHTMDASKVLTWDASGTHQIIKYYPLGLHACAALSARLSGSDIGRVLVAYIVVFSAVVFPLGMFVLGRMLAPGRPLVAGFTALVSSLVVLFPYWITWSGDVTLLISMTTAPAAVVLLRRAMLASHPPIRMSRAFLAAIVPAALAMLCMMAVSASEVPLVVFLAALLVLERAWRKRDPGVLVPALARGAAAGTLALALFAPTIVSFVHGVTERASVPALVDENPANWGSAVGRILQLHAGNGRQGLLTLLALVGAALCLMRRRPAWAGGWAAVFFVTLFSAASTNRLAHDLTLPWHHFDDRILPNMAFFVAFFAGVTLASAVVSLARAAPRPWAIVPATLVVLALFVGLTGLDSYRAASTFVQKSWNPAVTTLPNQAYLDHHALAAFDYLHDHVKKGDTVANEPFIDGSLWMYAQRRVVPLLGLSVGFGATDPHSDLARRIFLVNSIQVLGHSPRAERLVRRYRTKWVFYDRHVFHAPEVMSLRALKANPNLVLGFHQGSTYVFRIRAKLISCFRCASRSRQPRPAG